MFMKKGLDKLCVICYTIAKGEDGNGKVSTSEAHTELGNYRL